AGSACNDSYTVKLVVTDGQTCPSNCEKTINVVDTSAPVLSGVPSGGDLGCNPTTLPSCATATATDNCDSSPTVTCVPGAITGTCNKSQTFTYTATDDCGNSAVSTATYTWKQDTTNPVLVGVPAGGDLGCNPTLPTCANVTATDNCDGSLGAATCVPGAITGAGCLKSQTFVYSAVDACGNSASTSAIYTWKEDTTEPVLAGVPDGGDLGCNPATLPSCNNGVTASDNCDGGLQVQCAPGEIRSKGCSRAQDFVYTATDACGNSASASVRYGWTEDTTPPVLVGVPGGGDLGCNPTAPPSCDTGVTATDDCVRELQVTCTPGAITGDCLKSQTFVYSAVDACGNSASTSAIYTWKEDSTGPDLTCPPNKELQCGDPIVPGFTGTGTATDACGTATVDFSDQPIPPNCTGLPGISRTWTATDDCGNTSTCQQTIVFVDTTPPTIQCPGDVTVECNTPYDPSVTGRPTSSDNCGGEILVDFDDGGLTGPEPGCAGAPIPRTWTVTDNCGNSATCVQIISFEDTHAPSIHCPTDIEVGACDNKPTFTATGEDDCDDTPTIVCVPPSGSEFPVGTTEVTCTATDDCGNSTSCGFDVTVTGLPSCDIEGASAICAGTTTELCGPAGATSWSWTGPGGFSAGTQCVTVGAEGTYTLETTDAKGCKSTCTHDLTLNDQPVCGITGPTETCTGESVDLCGPAGNYSYAWSGPGGFNAASQCITVSTGGTYTLVVTDLVTKCSSDGCSHELTVAPCAVSCPRTPGFWSAQCDQKSGGSTKFNVAQMTQISECVDGKVDIFTWAAGSDFSSFCSAVSNGGVMNQRRQAKRQFAALLANVCTGELGLVASNGDIIKLDPSTPVSCSGLSSTTIGALITEVDGVLLTLEGQPLSSPVVKAMYSQIIACLDAINNAENVGTVACTSAAAENAMYRDYQTPGDGGLTEVVELYRPSPNPFALATRIAYVVRGTGERVDIGVFDLAGRKIRSLASGFQPAGRYEVTWNGVSDDGARVNNGVYFVRSTLAGQHQSMRVIYVK
ncbi:MAG TPA: HYR domain-containing protein, partial [Mycobacterium sp.]|nr:HYR domain-containing protein [Mycobacterium sp.]